MKIERIILVVVLVLVIFIALIALFIYKAFTPGANVHSGPEVQAPTTSTQSATSSTQIPDSADNHSAIDECVALKTSEAQGKEFERGSLLVTFQDVATYDIAVEILGLLNLTSDTSKTAQDNFKTYHWLTVTVPVGEEFKWQCVLEASEGIKAARLNTTFRLRQ